MDDSFDEHYLNQNILKSGEYLKQTDKINAMFLNRNDTLFSINKINKITRFTCRVIT